MPSFHTQERCRSEEINDALKITHLVSEIPTTSCDRAPGPGRSILAVSQQGWVQEVSLSTVSVQDFF